MIARNCPLGARRSASAALPRTQTEDVLGHHALQGPAMVLTAHPHEALAGHGQPTGSVLQNAQLLAASARLFRHVGQNQTR